MRSVKKVLVAMIICVLAFAIISSNEVLASTPEAMMGIIGNQANAEANDSVTGSVTNISGSIITIARVICAAVAVAMLAILGMKYMSSAPSEKADIKKHAVIYIVGAVIMFACTGILGIIQQFAAGL